MNSRLVTHFGDNPDNPQNSVRIIVDLLDDSFVCNSEESSNFSAYDDMGRVSFHYYSSLIYVLNTTYSETTALITLNVT